MVTTSYWSGKDSIAFGMISNVVVHDNDLYFVLGVYINSPAILFFFASKSTKCAFRNEWEVYGLVYRNCLKKRMRLIL